MPLLDRLDLGELRDALKGRRLDAWLLFDFHGANPVARRVIGFSEMVTRRLFVWLPAVGEPQAIVHSLDAHALQAFPGAVDRYTTWEELHRRLATLVRGRRVAMEVSIEDAVPYLDRVPAGVVELLQRFGATVVPSAPLVTQFAARWSPAERRQHRAVAESLAEIARATLGRVVQEPGRASEVAVQAQVLDAVHRAGWSTIEPPIVAFGAHGANPHYTPGDGRDATLRDGDVVLLDLWARSSPEGIWADQTWVALAAGEVSGELARIWAAVRDARDAVVEQLRVARAADRRVTGAELDAVARQLIAERGYGEWFVHRTGHSIDHEVHGSGPHLDDFETHDIRELLPGVGFSVEPGIYLPGRLGVRSEINVLLGADGPEVTPATPQRDLIVRP